MSRARLPWTRYAEGSEVAHFAAFCREHLEQSVDEWAGKPLVLEPWQRAMMGEALAYDTDGWPIWQSIVFVIPRKNGKTSLLAAYAVYRLLTSDGSPEILLAAASDKNAGRLFDAAATFVRRSPVLSELARVRDYTGEIVREDGLGIIRRLASDPHKMHGYNPSLVVCDELAQWVTPSLRRAYAALTSAGGARSAPQVFTITTAGEAHERASSILGRLLDAAAAAEDREERPGLEVARLWEARTLVYNYHAPTVDPADVRAMKLANPATWITLDYLRRQAANPELTRAQVLQLHGCVWAETETTWIDPASWAKLRSSRRLQDGETVVLGFDGSERRDMTVLAAATLDGHVEVLRAWRRPEGASAEWRIPRSEVHEEIDSAFERFDVRELAADPPGWYGEIEQWSELYGSRIVEFETRQPRRMAPACERFRTDVLEGRISHTGDELLASAVGNCVAKETPWGTVVTKDHPDSPRKIDAAVACIIAYERAMWHAANRVSQPWAASW
jgi:phage terminase large subunit-like protein